MPSRKSRDRFMTLMVIPEKSQSVVRMVVPYFLVKLGVALISMGAVVLVLVGLDYIHVIGNLAENKRLKGENYKLRREIQQIRNKVETMESTIERVSNYARKLQLLTGDDKGTLLRGLPKGGADEIPIDRTPANVKQGTPKWEDLPSLEENGDRQGRLDPLKSEFLSKRIEVLQGVTGEAELVLSRVQVSLLNRRAMMNATPSLAPVAGWVSSRFGRRRHPYDGSIRLHTGVDIAAEPGSPIRAPADGLILYSGYREGYGKVIVINHGYNITTLLAHNSELFYNAGERVKRGDVIARVGSTGVSTGAHVHFEIRKNGIPVNPETFLYRQKF